MLDNWVTVLGNLGIKKPKASAMLQQVEMAIAGTLTGVWKVFTEEAHETNAGTTKRGKGHQEMRDMMALLAETGRPVARHKEIWLFDSPSATQRKWLRSKRMLRPEPRGGRQQTSEDCDIGPRARGAELEAPGRCPEHSAIGRINEAEILRDWERTQQSGVCGECGVDVVAPAEERMTRLHGRGWEFQGGEIRSEGLSQADSLNQQGPVGELMDMSSQLELPVVASVDTALNASDSAAQGTDRGMQAGGTGGGGEKIRGEANTFWWVDCDFFS